MNSNSLGYYMSLPYKIEIVHDEEGTGFNASIPDLKGCVAWGATVENVYEVITATKQAWIEIALERGWRIPEPTRETAAKGDRLMGDEVGSAGAVKWEYFCTYFKDEHLSDALKTHKAQGWEVEDAFPSREGFRLILRRPVLQEAADDRE